MPNRHHQYFLPTTQLVLADPTAIAAVMAFGASVPHDSTIKHVGDKIHLTQGGTAALAAPTVGDGGAAEFDVAISGAGPWDVQLTWNAGTLAGLARGVYNRTITVTSAGAVNSPLSIPVTINVL
jgi:hypothetical protein